MFNATTTGGSASGPASACAAGAPAPSCGASGSEAPGPPRTRDEKRPLLLLVEDEPLVRQMTARMIQRLGYRVVLAANGQEGLETIEARANELSGVVLDIVMPVMNGKEMLRALRRRGLVVPVLVCSGYALDLGNDDDAGMLVRSVLRKPYTFEQLRLKLERLVC